MAGFKSQYDDRLTRVEKLTKELTQLKSNVDNIAKAEQVLLFLSSTILGKSTKTIDKLLTNGFRLVFDDQNLTFATSIDKYRGKTSVKFELLEDGRSVPIMDSYGGGVIVIAGLLLRVATIMLLNLRKVIFLDESLSHLSEQYHSNASRLIRQLCEKLDFTIVMVTHQPAFAEHAHYHFLATKTASGTNFTVQKTTKQEA